VPGVMIAEQNSHRMTRVVDGDLNPLLGVLAAHPVAELVMAPPSLDDVFMGFYGRDDLPTRELQTVGAGSTSR
jgi:hypothetical protein